MRRNTSLLFLAIAALWAGSLWADDWWCNIQLPLTGKSQYYFLHGRDSWEGSVQMDCKSQNISIRRYVRVSFNSIRPGFGATPSSSVQFALNVWMAVDPWEYKARVLVNGTTQGSYVYYDAESASSSISGRAWSNETPAIVQSLSQGYLSIDPANGPVYSER